VRLVPIDKAIATHQKRLDDYSGALANAAGHLSSFAPDALVVHSVVRATVGRDDDYQPVLLAVCQAGVYWIQVVAERGLLRRSYPDPRSGVDYYENYDRVFQNALSMTSIYSETGSPDCFWTAMNDTIATISTAAAELTVSIAAAGFAGSYGSDLANPYGMPGNEVIEEALRTLTALTGGDSGPTGRKPPSQAGPPQWLGRKPHPLGPNLMGVRLSSGAAAHLAHAVSGLGGKVVDLFEHRSHLNLLLAERFNSRSLDMGANLKPGEVVHGISEFSERSVGTSH